MEELIRRFEGIRKSEYSRLGDQVYLDHTGTALYTSSHLQTYFNELQSNVFGNPHSGSACSKHTQDIVHQVRSKVLQFFNTTADDYNVIFTSGATEGLHILGRAFNWTEDSVFAYLEDNHTSVVGIREIACESGADSYCISLKKSSIQTDTSKTMSYSTNLVKKSHTDHRKSAAKMGNAPCLFAYPAESNFSGAIYSLQWIEQIQKFGINYTTSPDASNLAQKWYVLCDAAAFVSTSPLNLQQYSADFVTVSFYKIFGFPTGLGALLVRREVEDVLCKKDFFGGGSVSGWLASRDFYKPKSVLHESLEKGSVPFLDILALKHGFDTFKELGISMHCIQRYTNYLWKYLYGEMSSLKHVNGMPVIEIYTINDEDANFSSQGPILAFNVRRSDGSYVGFNTVLQLANSNNIYLRGGCFCNVGACACMLNVSNDLLLEAYESGHVCGDSIDIMDGRPIGALRASLGLSSTKHDIRRLVDFISSCFQEDIISSPRSDLRILNKQEDIFLEKIFVYPIKSCQGMAVDCWDITNTGLKCDRMWMIVDDHGICVNLRKNPALVSIFPVVLLSKQVLVMKADGMNDIEVPFIHDDDVRSTNCSIGGDRCITKICGDQIEGHDCGENASIWLSVVLGKKCFLVQKRFGMRRYSKSIGKVEDDCEIALANEAQYLLVNLSSVRYLYDKMNEAENGVSQDEIKDLARRFRGNFIVSGASAFSEDSWSKLSVWSQNDAGNGHERLRFKRRGLCNRCSMICVDPNTGRKLNDPLKTLANLTTSKGRRRPTFGIYLQCEAKSATIRAKTRLFPEQ